MVMSEASKETKEGAQSATIQESSIDVETGKLPTPRAEKDESTQHSNDEDKDGGHMDEITSAVTVYDWLWVPMLLLALIILGVFVYAVAAGGEIDKDSSVRKYPHNI
ncbi:expressed unknown protein [Seminavis robusta]|uniref:Uncharacterized protein n=1 Tax=Seminavis robusta TaxID=568900 RepID=A0A9N8EPG6_9STRA|nr:expressed unknown protein [Seminavis robusta]|eukprot:Sro1695_g291790.1 n/a (107) ;mRNA; r:16006-16326